MLFMNFLKQIKQFTTIRKQINFWNWNLGTETQKQKHFETEIDPLSDWNRNIETETQYEQNRPIIRLRQTHHITEKTHHKTEPGPS